MISTVQVEKMVILSDLHLGNPFSTAREEVIRFLRWHAENGFDVCINGDGLEIAQASFTKLAQEIPDILRVCRDINRMGRKIYYIVGNHDIALEHFLEDWGALEVTPFLNVTWGDLRVRIEHGHLYDPFFVKFPNLYELLTRAAGLLLGIHPSFYKLWIQLERLRARLRARRTGIIGEPPEFAEAALELSERGFDVVVFGHTHHRGEIKLSNDKRYLNPGSWLLSPDFVEINHGRVELKRWTPRSAGI